MKITKFKSHVGKFVRVAYSMDVQSFLDDETTSIKSRCDCVKDILIVDVSPLSGLTNLYFIDIREPNSSVHWIMHNWNATFTSIKEIEEEWDSLLSSEDEETRACAAVLSQYRMFPGWTGWPYCTTDFSLILERGVARDYRQKDYEEEEDPSSYSLVQLCKRES